MKKYASPLILLLALILISSGCSTGSPVTSPGRGDSAGDILGAMDPSTGVASAIHPRSPNPMDDVRNLPRYADGEVLIVLNDGVDPATLTPIAKGMGLSLIQEIKLMWGTVYRMSLDNGGSVKSMVASLLTYPEVRYAEPNLILYPCATTYYPNDPLFEYDADPDNDPWNNVYDQWGPNILGASLVWPEYKGSPDVVICVLDTGYRWSHEDLVNQIWINEDEIPDNGIDDDVNGYIDDWRGWDTASNDNDPWDEYGHGTACSGVVAAQQDNGLGCTGIAPGVKVMAVRCDLMGGGGYESSVIEGVQYAYDNGATAVSMSFRTYSDSDIMHNSFTATYDNGNGLLPVGAAGNEDSDQLTYPACWPEILEVGGTSSFHASNYSRRDVLRIQSSEFGWGSNWGPNLSLMAPGVFYIATNVGSDSSYYDGGGNGFFGGTSNATPCVAATVALLKSVHPEMTALQLRQRLEATADDLYTPGHDDQSGWGQVNIWRAIYGSDPNSADYDADGHLPLSTDGVLNYDNIFDVPASSDYDAEDTFVITADNDGVLKIDMDIIVTGEDLDMELYDNSELSGDPIMASTGTNGETRPIESISIVVSAGQKYYVRVYSPAEYNTSTYQISSQVIPLIYWVEWKSIAPVFVLNGANDLPLLQVEVHSNIDITINDINAYMYGDIPLNLVNNIRLYQDTNNSQTWDWFDTQVGYIEPGVAHMNQAGFTGLSGTASFGNPARYFVIADVGPNNLGYNVTVGAGLRTYKDVEIQEDVPLANDPYPFFSDLTILGEDHEPPVWDTTVGIQYAEPSYQSAVVYWNNATDQLSEPTGYNAYWDDIYPPIIKPEHKVANIPFSDGGTYDHRGVVPGLANDITSYICIRAVDQLGNEENNTVWLEIVPGAVADPENPQIIGTLPLDGSAWEVVVKDQIAYLACADAGLAMVDCTSPSSPVLLNYYPLQGCYGVAYHPTQNYIYTASDNGLYIFSKTGNSLSLVGSYTDAYGAVDVAVDGNLCFIGDWWGVVKVLDISDPANPQYQGEVNLGDNQSIYGIAAKDGYAYACTAGAGFKVIDANNPSNPHVVKTVQLQQTTYEVCLFGNYAHVSNWSQGRFYVVDILDPPNAFRIGSLDLNGGYGAGVAVRDNDYSYVGRFNTTLWSVDWSPPDGLGHVGGVTTDGPDGLFFDGTFLYAAENEDGLKILL